MANNDGNDRRGRGRWQGFDFGGGGGQGSRSPWRFSLVYIVLAILLLFVVQGFFRPGTQVVPLNQFFNQLKGGQVQEVTIGTDSLSWTTDGGQQFKSTLPTNFETQ